VPGSALGDRGVDDSDCREDNEADLERRDEDLRSTMFCEAGEDIRRDSKFSRCCLERDDHHLRQYHKQPNNFLISSL